jgi:hypothetical protein
MHIIDHLKEERKGTHFEKIMIVNIYLVIGFNQCSTSVLKLNFKILKTVAVFI